MKRAELILKLRQSLLRRRDALRRTLADDLNSLGSLEDEDEPSGDDVYSRLAESESREMTAIENALSRMRDGEYGLCEECGDKIPLARLQALPYASTCIKCQRNSEKTPGSNSTRQHWSRVVDLADDEREKRQPELLLAK